MPARSRRSAVAIVAAALLMTVGLTGCAGDSDDGRIHVVASTNVWGSVAEAVAGPDAEVTSIIDDPSADPHSYESSPADAAAVIDADLVVFNGGGYDEFIEKILDSEPDKPTIEAFAALASSDATDSHEGHDNSSVNEHVWYDMPTVQAVAEQIADKLADLDPDRAADFHSRAASFAGQLYGVTAITAQIATQHPGAPVVQSEPIAYYLLQAAGAQDVTPQDLENAIEEGTDPSPNAVAQTRDLLASSSVRALLWNSQTQDKLTEEFRKVAQDNGIPVVAVSETLPEGTDFATWQTDNAQHLADALGQPR
ncbi:zinc ABC transporter substrate-binding protein [Aldersonia sp. NBC_00410]|uniref:metal ABC transporter solute-binding protein, Zn/Mn family n=1 Tax=Aldersonia sp. NBC_00410 TaxID=2975954 RepID=UPI002256F8C7|nr:zinc ABC transporter substrate-binding protein [Aldersonia sp. NBC_00410]MCX5043267.1 zinc ABC transporter substrate-binding protein [Aldersonia sp. NBC_00410]